jgi:hypothetical protein
MKETANISRRVTSFEQRQVMKTEYQRKEEAKEKAARELQRTKARLGLGPPGPLKGAIASPLAASPKTRRSKLPPTSDRIPGARRHQICCTLISGSETSRRRPTPRARCAGRPHRLGRPTIRVPCSICRARLRRTTGRPGRRGRRRQTCKTARLAISGVDVSPEAAGSSKSRRHFRALFQGLEDRRFGRHLNVVEAAPSAKNAGRTARVAIILSPAKRKLSLR